MHTRTPERAEFENYRQSITNSSRRRSIADDEVEERMVQQHNLGYVDDDTYLWKDDGIIRWKNARPIDESKQRDAAILSVDTGASGIFNELK